MRAPSASVAALSGTKEGVQFGGTMLTLEDTEAMSVEGGEGNDTYRFTGLCTTTAISDKKGIDKFDFSEASDGVTLNLNTTRVQNVFGQSLTVKSSPEILIGSRYEDTLTGAKSGSFIDGGEGQDTLTASGGRNVLIGGAAVDVIFGSGGEDLLIGGTCDTLPDELYLNWCAAKGKFNVRTATLSNIRSSVADDGATDRLQGGMGQDWFFGMEDEFLDFDTTSKAKDKAN